VLLLQPCVCTVGIHNEVKKQNKSMAAHLAELIVLQSIQPEGDIADEASRVEVGEWEDLGLGLPIVVLQRCQPVIPTARAEAHMLTYLSCEHGILPACVSEPVTDL
jgi:hypothetical protein